MHKFQQNFFMVTARFIFILTIMALMMTGCASDAPRDRAGVKEAKACVKAFNARKTILDTYEIKSCTNNGVWIATNIASGEIFDFLNKTYTSPVRGEIELSDMPHDKAAIFTSLRKDINKELVRLYY
jgi:hypothetical protein